MNQEKNYSWILLLLCGAIFLVHLVLGILGFISITRVIIAPGMGLSVVLIIYFVFQNGLKNNDFTMIAGYDKNKKYDLSVFRRVLLNIQYFTLLLTLITNIFYSIIFVVDENKQMLVSMIFLFIYIINLISVVIIVNLKYKDEIEIK